MKIYLQKGTKNNMIIVMGWNARSNANLLGAQITSRSNMQGVHIGTLTTSKTISYFFCFLAFSLCGEE